MQHKICKQECAGIHSHEWALSAQLAKLNKRLLAMVIIVSILWIGTMASFAWHLCHDCVSGASVSHERTTIDEDGLLQG